MGNQASYNITPNTENINLTDQHLTKLPFTPPLENKAKNLYLSGNKFITLPENMKNVLLVDLSKNQMGSSVPIHIAKALASYENLKKLNLSSNQLEKLNDSLTNKKVESLNLTQNRFNEFPDQLIVKFPSLEIISLDCNFLKVLSKLQSELIITLSISLNCIQSIETATLSLPKLTTLDLSKNQIKVIPDNFSKSFPALTSIDLSDNLITELPEVNSETSDNFVFPQTLKQINLTHNFLVNIPKSILCLPNLTELVLAENKITNLPDFQPSIKKIDVSSNQIESISKQSLKFLVDILLADNKLTELPEGLEMEQAETFTADRNQIKEINFTSFPSTIIAIDLSFNQIEQIPNEIFEKLPKLQSFSVDFNKITEIPTEIINCTKLQRLSVSHNPIKELPKMPVTLQNISASCCQLESVEGAFFDRTQPSRFFTHDGNSTNDADDFVLACISSNNYHSQTYSHPFMNLKYVDFSGNQLKSFPRIFDLQIINLSQNKLTELPVISSHTKILDVSMNNITSEPNSIPEEISGNSLVDLNLSYNKLTKIPKFLDAPLLQCLELAGNPLKGTLDITELIFLDTVDISETEITTVNSTNELLREIITSKNDLNITPIIKNDPKTTFAAKKKQLYVNQKKQDGKMKSGFSEILGLRKDMEDSIIVRDDLNLYAVCDGHGGSNTAKYVAIKLSELFEKYFENQIHQQSFNKNLHIKNNLFTFEKVKHAIESVINETGKCLQKHNFQDGSTLCLSFIYDSPCAKQTSPSDDPSSDSSSYSLFVGRKLVTANLGDSRAIIIRTDGTSRELTKDHKPFFRSEFERIHNDYGRISKDNRVDGILAVSRAMGDYHVSGVCRDAEIEEFEIDNEKDKFLVIGCDGVFDVLTNDEVAQVAVNASSPTEAAFMIRNAAFAVQSSDNISVVVVDLMSKIA